MISFNKLIYFYKRKLGNWNLVHSFISRWWKSYLLLFLLLTVAFVCGVYYLKAYLIAIFISYVCLIIILFYWMIVARARRFLRLRYKLRSFKEFMQLREYLFYAYLCRNGFKTRDDLDELIDFIKSESKLDKKNNHFVWLKGFGYFMIIFFAVLAGRLLFELKEVEVQVFTVIFILLFVFLLFILISRISQISRYFSTKKKRHALSMIEEIIAMKMRLLVAENTEYTPYLSMEKKVSENDFLKEIISSKSFI
ncbi:hypothetical protein [Listeria sp. PSOL-1]|uniref:hypothetical protein n=1 Tax=Listeria sp. PSOL-1 TaxID=1844999 RepID=UPI0013D725E4|nr:hypothetical protein [Listeria sp. PSOL-1]